MLNDRVILTAFMISFIGHSLFLGWPGMNINSVQFDKPQETVLNVEIEKVSLLPKIDTMGDETRLRETVESQEPPELELTPLEKVINFRPIKNLTLQNSICNEVKEQNSLTGFTPLEKNLVAQQTVCAGSVGEPSLVFSKKQTEEKVDLADSEKEQMLRYQDMIKQKIEEARRYPLWAKRQGLEGKVYINFIVLADGLSRDIRVIRSDSSKFLDEEAVKTIKRAEPFPPIPKEINTAQVQMEVAIVFSLK